MGDILGIVFKHDLYLLFLSTICSQVANYSFNSFINLGLTESLVMFCYLLPMLL